MYELAAGESYRDPDAIRQQYYTLPMPDVQPHSTPIGTIRLEIAIKWMTVTHQLLNCFISCNTDTMRQIPNLIYTRVGTAALFLLEIHASAVSKDFGVFLQSQDVKVNVYLNAMVKRLAEANDGGTHEIPSRWYHVIAVKGRDWYARFQKERVQQDAAS